MASNPTVLEFGMEQAGIHLAPGAIGVYGHFIIRYQNKIFVQQGDNRLWAWDLLTLHWDSIPGSLTDGLIRTACIDQNNDLILAGEFTKIGSQSMYNIVRFDGTQFYPIGNPQFVNLIRTIAIYKNELYIGGFFFAPHDKGIMKWDGSQWIDVGGGFEGGNPPDVLDLKVYRNRLYAGGAYYGTDNKHVPSLAAWDGTKWSPIGDGIYYTWHPWGIVGKMLEKDGKLYIGGNFDRAGDVNAFNMAIWNDTNWCSTNINFVNPVYLATIFQNQLYIAGHYYIDSDTIHEIGYYVGASLIGVCGAPVGINEIIISETIRVYPNPVTSVLNIVDEQNELQNSTIEITNNIGQTVLQLAFNSSIDVSTLPEGCYFIAITTRENQQLRSRFVKY